jgi:hypothetical protein
MVEELAQEVPAFPMTMPQGGLLSDKYDQTWNAERIYDDMGVDDQQDDQQDGQQQGGQDGQQQGDRQQGADDQQQDQQDGQGGQDGQQQDQQDGQGGQQQDGQQGGQAGQQQDADDQQGGQGVPWGEVIPPKNENGSVMTGADLENLEQEINDNLVAAAEAAENKRPGSVPGYIEKEIAKIRDMSVDWEDVIVRFSEGEQPDDYSYRRFNRRRLVTTGTICPTIEREGVGNIAIGWDVSGSCSVREQEKFRGVLNRVIEDLAPESVLIVFADTRVQGTEYPRHPEGQGFRRNPNRAGLRLHRGKRVRGGQPDLPHRYGVLHEDGPARLPGSLGVNPAGDGAAVWRHRNHAGGSRMRWSEMPANKIRLPFNPDGMTARDLKTCASILRSLRMNWDVLKAQTGADKVDDDAAWAEFYKEVGQRVHQFIGTLEIEE